MKRLKSKILNIFRNEFWYKLFKNVATVFWGNGGASVANFIVTILLVKIIGNKEYGLLLVALQYMNLLDGIFNFQSWAGVIKYGSEAIVNENKDRLYAIFKGGFLIDISTAILGCIIAVLLLPLVSSVLKWDDTLSYMALLFSIEIVFHIEGTSIGVLRMYNRFKLTAIQNVCAAIIKLISIGIYVGIGGRSTKTIAFIYVITDIIKHLLLVVFALKVLNEKKEIRKIVKADLHILEKQFLKYTIWNNVSYTVDVPVKYIDVFIINMISSDMVAIYKVFRQIIQILSMLTTPISMAIMPQFSELVAKNKTREAYSKVIKLRNAILLVGSVALLVTLICGKLIFYTFLGEEYGKNIMIFIVLLITQIILMSYVAIHPFFSSLGHAKEDFLYTLITNLIYLGLAFVLVDIIGIYGIIVSIFVQGMTYIILKTIYIYKHDLYISGA